MKTVYMRISAQHVTFIRGVNCVFGVIGIQFSSLSLQIASTENTHLVAVILLSFRMNQIQKTHFKYEYSHLHLEFILLLTKRKKQQPMRFFFFFFVSSCCVGTWYATENIICSMRPSLS